MNVGVTVVIAWKVTRDLEGGQHVMFDITEDNEPIHALVFDDHPDGILFMGDYRNLLHSNFGTIRGERFVMSGYCALKVVRACERGAHGGL